MRLPRPKEVVRVRIGGGASNVELIRPTVVPVRVHIGGGVSRLAIDDFRLGSAGGKTDWRSPDYEQVAADTTSRSGQEPAESPSELERRKRRGAAFEVAGVVEREDDRRDDGQVTADPDDGEPALIRTLGEAVPHDASHAQQGLTPARKASTSAQIELEPLACDGGTTTPRTSRRPLGVSSAAGHSDPRR